MACIGTDRIIARTTSDGHQQHDDQLRLHERRPRNVPEIRQRRQPLLETFQPVGFARLGHRCRHIILPAGPGPLFADLLVEALVVPLAMPAQRASSSAAESVSHTRRKPCSSWLRIQPPGRPLYRTILDQPSSSTLPIVSAVCSPNSASSSRVACSHRNVSNSARSWSATVRTQLSTGSLRCLPYLVLPWPARHRTFVPAPVAVAVQGSDPGVCQLRQDLVGGLEVAADLRGYLAGQRELV